LRTCSVAGADPVHRPAPKVVQLLLLCSELCDAAVIAWPVWQHHILQYHEIGMASRQERQQHTLVKVQYGTLPERTPGTA
jgi:hypothetical protein